MGRLSGRVALVTGGGRGIGRSIALALARDGAKVAVSSRTKKELEAVAAEIGKLGSEGSAIVCDALDREGTKRTVAAVIDRFGRLDVLVNNAGVGVGAPVAEHQTKRVDMQLDLNLRSIILFYRECADLLRAAGAEHKNALVVNTASIAGKSGQAWLSVYSATKFAVVGWTQSMNKELNGEGIKSLALCPGFVETAMTEFIRDQVPAEEMIRTSDVAEAVRFALHVSPACVIPEIIFQRPGETA
jgi:NAD(P)-dependent dehydrogenase (short-subunit alcohol dehydrogenase family)